MSHNVAKINVIVKVWLLKHSYVDAGNDLITAEDVYIMV